MGGDGNLECFSGEIFDVGTGGGTLGGGTKGGGIRLGGRGGWFFSGTATKEEGGLIVIFSYDCFVETWSFLTGTIGGGGGTKAGMDFLEGDGGGKALDCSGGEEWVPVEVLASLLFIKKPSILDFLRVLIVYDWHTLWQLTIWFWLSGSEWEEVCFWIWATAWTACL